MSELQKLITAEEKMLTFLREQIGRGEFDNKAANALAYDAAFNFKIGVNFLHKIDIAANIYAQSQYSQRMDFDDSTTTVFYAVLKAVVRSRIALSEGEDAAYNAVIDINKLVIGE